MKLTKLRLILDVDFNAETVNMPVLRGHLEQVVKDAVNNGTLTGDSPATVEHYSFKITRPPTKKRSVRHPKLQKVLDAVSKDQAKQLFHEHDVLELID